MEQLAPSYHQATPEIDIPITREELAKAESVAELSTSSFSCPEVSADIRANILLLGKSLEAHSSYFTLEQIQSIPTNTKFWLDIHVEDLVPEIMSSTPREEHNEVLCLAQKSLSKIGKQFDEDQICIINVREFVNDVSDPTIVKKSKLYTLVHRDMIITVRDGDGECAERVLARTKKDLDIDPIQIAYLLIESTVDPLDQVLHSFERHQSHLLDMNSNIHGINESDLNSLPILARTVGYIQQRSLAMVNAIKFFHGYINQRIDGIDDNIAKSTSDRLSLLSDHLQVYGKRCETLLGNIVMLQDAVQIADQKKTMIIQQECNRRQQMFSNRFTFLAGVVGPIAIGIGLVDAFNVTGTSAHFLIVASAIVSGLLVAFRDVNVSWLDGPK